MRRRTVLSAIAVVVVIAVVAGVTLVATGRIRLGGQSGSWAQVPSGAFAWSDPNVIAITAPAPPPLALVIPSLQVNAPVEAVGVDSQGRMATPSVPEHVAWFMPSAAPGDAGTAVIAGHLDWTNGPAVFWHLADLQPGSEIDIVRPNGGQVKFVVDTTTNYPFDSDPPDLFTHTGEPGIALVTCAGSWDIQRHTYLQRLAVHAKLAPTAPVSNPGDEGG